MHAFWASLIALAQRRGSGARPAGGPSLGRMLWDEVRWAAGAAVHPVKMGAAAIVVLGVGIALGPTTPGPVLGAGWRLAVSIILGFVTLSVAHTMLQRRESQSPGEQTEELQALRVLIAAVALLLAGTLMLAYLLAAITGSDQGPTSQALAVSLPIDRPLAAGAALMIAGVVVAGVSGRLAVPGSVVFLGLGLLIGPDGLGLIDLTDPGLVQSLGVAALVIILFDGGVTTDAARLRQGAGPGLALATLGVALTAGITAIGTILLLDVPPRVAWLFGAIVASTDGAAVFTLLRRAPLPERLASILQIESGANDPVAVLLTVGLLASWDAPPAAASWLGFGAMQLIGGVVVGVSVGWVASAMLRRLRFGTDAMYPLLAIAVAGATYGLAARLGASGFLATYLAGIVIAAEAPRRRRSIRSFLSAIAGGAEVGMFLLLGLLVSLSVLREVGVAALGITVVLLVVARPLAVAVTLAWFDLGARGIAAVSWLGMRGAVPIAVSTLVLAAGIPEAELVVDLVFVVVVTSALLQGTVATSLIRWLGLDKEPIPARSMVEAIPLEDIAVDLLEITLTDVCELEGKELRATDPPEDLLLIAVVRDGRVRVPRGSTRLLAGDRLVISTTDQEHGVRRAQQWVHGSAAGVRALHQADRRRPA